MFLLFAACSDDEKNANNESIPGTESPQTEQTDTYEVTYQYHDDVIVLTENNQRYIERVEDDSIVFFRKDTPPDMLPAEGDIISSRASDKLPYGLGNVVLSRTEEDGAYRCVTSIASLDEIFSELKLKVSMPLTEGIDGFMDDDGVWHDVEYVDTFDDDETDVQSVSRARYSSVKKLPLLSFDYGEEAPETGTGAYSFGKIFVTGILNVDFDLDSKAYHILLSPRVGLHGSLVSMMHANGYKELFKKMELVQTSIPVGPVVIRPAFGLELGVEGSVDGNIRVDWTKEFAATCGFVNEGTSQQVVYENTTPEGQNVIRGLSVDAKGHAAVVVKCYLTTGLYTRAIVCGLAPGFKLGADVDFKMDNPNLLKNESKLAANVNFELSGVLYAKALSRVLLNKQVTWVDIPLWEREWPLFPVLKSMDYTYRSSNSRITYTFSDLGLLSHFVDIYHGVKLYYGLAPHWEPVRVEMSEEPLDATAGELTYTHVVKEAGGGYTACPILQVGEFYFEGDTCSYGMSKKW